jgi:hypothetical protein
VAIWSSTNLALPIAAWIPTTNVIVPSAGQLRADGFNVTNSTSRFFRAVEAP